MESVGSYQPIEITQKESLLVNQLVNEINQKLELCVECWTINKAWGQVVAGTNYYFFITADSGDYVTVSIFDPLPNTNCTAKLENA